MTGFPEPLLKGYRRFRTGRYAQERGRYRLLAEQGQAPETMVIACCDSRAAPETIFSAAPGELFVLRNVANLVPPCEPGRLCRATAAALEFAVQGLEVRHIVVLGHGRCGGVRAALDPPAAPLSAGDFVGGWMRPLAPAAAAAAGGADRQTALERASVRRSIANLGTYPFVSTLAGRGRLSLHGAWFDIAEGALWALDPATGVFSRAG